MLLDHGHLHHSHADCIPDARFHDFGMVSHRASTMPPFWELEALIAAGCDLSEACLVLAARREARMIGGAPPHRRGHAAGRR
jgi:hypothetical protein